MSAIVPDPVDAYLTSLLPSSDPLLEEIARSGQARGLPLVGAQVGALLSVLVTAVGAHRVLEIGTGIGYSGIWLARALPPDGQLLSIEIDERRAREARANFARAGLADRATVIVGNADRIVRKLAGPFDVIFNDGDKLQYPSLLDRLVDLLRPRGLLVTDNVLWGGEVIPGYLAAPARPADQTEAIRQFTARLMRHPALTTIVVPIRDGVAVSVRRP
jgi:caffeoyl-CoA O-methyltransferase